MTGIRLKMLLTSKVVKNSSSKFQLATFIIVKSTYMIHSERIRLCICKERERECVCVGVGVCVCLQVCVKKERDNMRVCVFVSVCQEREG